MKRLQEALRGISMSVEIVEGRDIKELEWLSNWADVLRDARQQGGNVLDAVRAMARMETVECDFETDQLRSFVLTMESLAGEARYFDRLARSCPRNVREAKRIGDKQRCGNFLITEPVCVPTKWACMWHYNLTHNRLFLSVFSQYICNSR